MEALSCLLRPTVVRPGPATPARLTPNTVLKLAAKSPIGRVKPARLHIRTTGIQNPALTGGVLFLCTDEICPIYLMAGRCLVPFRVALGIGRFTCLTDTHHVH